MVNASEDNFGDSDDDTEYDQDLLGLATADPAVEQYQTAKAQGSVNASIVELCSDPTVLELINQMVDKKVNERLSTTGPMVTPPRVNEGVTIQQGSNPGTVHRVNNNQVISNVGQNLQLISDKADNVLQQPGQHLKSPSDTTIYTPALRKGQEVNCVFD